ncbi:MAG: polyphosphate kinase 2 [Ilumatobacteraceae bacterium]
MKQHRTPDVDGEGRDGDVSTTAEKPKKAGRKSKDKDRAEDDSDAVLPESIRDMESASAYAQRMKRASYETELELLQIEMLKMQRWVKETNQRVVILFEGRDAAGKGGSIRRFTENLNPRGARTVALAKPSEIETTQWYFQRYVANLPSGGEIVFFDRSWYNRAGVEIVMGFCTPHEHAEFFRQAPMFEESLVQSGIRLFKLWFTVSEVEQRKRFEDRLTDPLRQWKISPIDEASMGRYGEYSRARDEMLFYTDRPVSPWVLVNSNEKRRSRLESMRHVLHSLPYLYKDPEVARVADPYVVQPASSMALVPEIHRPFESG